MIPQSPTFFLGFCGAAWAFAGIAGKTETNFAVAKPMEL